MNDFYINHVLSKHSKFEIDILFFSLKDKNKFIKVFQLLFTTIIMIIHFQQVLINIDIEPSKNIQGEYFLCGKYVKVFHWDKNFFNLV